MARDMMTFEGRCVECGWTETHDTYPDAATARLEHAASCVQARTEIAERGADVVPEPLDGHRAWIPGFGLLRQVHDEQVCGDRESPCVIHRPTEHHMRTWPLGFGQFADAACVFRVCAHRVAHPDPDEYAWREDRRFDGLFHTCDGCCIPTGLDDSEPGEWLTDKTADEIRAAANTDGKGFNDIDDLVEDLRSDDPNDDYDLPTPGEPEGP